MDYRCTNRTRGQKCSLYRPVLGCDVGVGMVQARNRNRRCRTPRKSLLFHSAKTAFSRGSTEFLAGDCDIPDTCCAHVIEEATLGTGGGKVREPCKCAFRSAKQRDAFSLSPRTRFDRKRWFSAGRSTPGKPTDIAVIVASSAPNSVKRATLLNASVESDVLLKVYGFPGAQTPQGYISHPTGLYVEGKCGDLPGGRASFGTWVTGIAVRKIAAPVFTSEARRRWDGGRADPQRSDELPSSSTLAARLALGTIGSAAGALNIQRTRTIPQALYNQTVRKKQEIEPT